MVAMVQTASAVSISSVTLNSAGPGSPDVTFEGWPDGPQSGLLIPGGTLSYNYATIVQGPPNNNVGARPYPGDSDYLDYLSVKAGGNATFVFTDTRSSFGLQWGSVDTYNTIEFFLGAASQGAFTGTHIDLLAPTLILNSGNQGVNGSAYVTFSGQFDKVVLTSSQNSFEVDNISVPDGGSTLALLGGALVLVGAVSRRFRK
jgi:hypothetical protein